MCGSTKTKQTNLYSASSHCLSCSTEIATSPGCRKKREFVVFLESWNFFNLGPNSTCEIFPHKTNWNNSMHTLMLTHAVARKFTFQLHVANSIEPRVELKRVLNLWYFSNVCVYKWNENGKIPRRREPHRKWRSALYLNMKCAWCNGFDSDGKIIAFPLFSGNMYGRGYKNFNK